MLTCQYIDTLGATTMDTTRPLELIIDVSNSDNENSFIESIIQQFGFPDLYGKTWLSIREHFFYDSMIKVPELLIIKGMKPLKQRLPQCYTNFTSCLKEYSDSNSDFKFLIE